jgi:hypothetical protein
MLSGKHGGDMPYTVTWAVDTGEVMETKVCDDLDQAIQEANFAAFGGSKPVIITVTNEQGD